MRRLYAVLCVVATVFVATSHVSAAVPGFVRPVPGPIIRGFDLSNGPYGPGHRGIDLAAPVGSPVRAARSGNVEFAGKVAGTRYVTIASADGMQTRYGPLADSHVSAREKVEAGQVIATVGTPPAGLTPHLGFAVVVAGAYVDPAPYLSSGRVHLTPLDREDANPRPQPDTTASADDLAARFDDIAKSADAVLADAHARAADVAALVDDVAGAASDLQRFNRSAANDVAAVAARSTQVGGLSDRLGSLLVAADTALTRLRDLQEAPRRVIQDRLNQRRDPPLGRVLERPIAELDALFTMVSSLSTFAVEFSIVGATARALNAAADYQRNRRGCTASVALPHRIDPPPGRRVVAVEGFTSTYDGVEPGNLAAMLTELGYGNEQILRFSYAGHEPDGTPHAYARIDTGHDIELEARLLGDQLRAAHRADPGARFDLVGHSLGGVVIAFFLSHVYDPADDAFPVVDAAVTLNSPLQGVPLAQLGALLGDTDVLGSAIATSESVEARVGVPAAVEAIGQLAETSLFTYRLRSAWDFNGVDVTTIGTTTDWLVPAASAYHQAARHNVVIDAPDVGDRLDAHSSARDDPEARAAIVLALSGRNPACLNPGEFAKRRARAELAQYAEQYGAYELGLIAVLGGEFA